MAARSAGTDPLAHWARWAFVLLAAALLAIGIDWARDRAPAQPALKASDWRAAGYGPAGFAAARLQLDAQVAGRTELVRSQPDDWLQEEGLARALMRPTLLRLCIRELLSLFSWELVILVMCHCGEWRLAAVPRPVNQARVGTAAAGGSCCFFPH